MMAVDSGVDGGSKRSPMTESSGSEREALEIEKLKLETESMRRSSQPPPSSWLPTSADSLLRLLQLIAIVVAAGWGLYLYVTFQRTANQQLLEQQRLGNAQTLLQLQTVQGQRELRDLELRNQVALQELNRSQGELALKQSQFALDQEKTSAALRHSELENRVALQTLQGALDKTRIEREGLELAAAKDRGYACATNVDLLPSEGAVRNVSYSFSCEVVSRASIDATGIVVDYFIGNLDAPQIEKDRYALLAAPPGRWANTRPAPTALSWTRLGSWGGFASDIPAECRSLLRAVAPSVDFVEAAPGTGEWKQKEKFNFTSDLVLKASAEDYFGVAFNLILNKTCQPDGDPYNFVTYFGVKSLRLMDASQTASRNGSDALR